ncbi:ABC transporter [Lotmaria passim]
MMARALFHGRRGGTVLVMDEPTASLDHEVKMEILTEWRELLEKGIVRGMICATHDADLVNVADEVVRLP